MKTSYCPFCGFEEVRVCTHYHRLGTMAWVKCQHCHGCGSTMVEETKAEAIESAIRAWNEATPTLRYQIEVRVHNFLSDLMPDWFARWWYK